MTRSGETKNLDELILSGHLVIPTKLAEASTYRVWRSLYSLVLCLGGAPSFPEFQGSRLDHLSQKESEAAGGV